MASGDSQGRNRLRQQQQAGAVRALSIKDGPVIKEKLLAFSNTTHSFTYKFVDTPFPIKDYVSTLHVKANKDGTTLVRWSSTFKRKNPAENPRTRRTTRPASS